MELNVRVTTMTRRCHEGARTADRRSPLPFVVLLPLAAWSAPAVRNTQWLEAAGPTWENCFFLFDINDGKTQTP